MYAYLPARLCPRLRIIIIIKPFPFPLRPLRLIPPMQLIQVILKVFAQLHNSPQVIIRHHNLAFLVLLRIVLC